MKNQQLKTRLTILDGAIDKLDIDAPKSDQRGRLIILQERLRLVVLEWKLECLERGVEL